MPHGLKQNRGHFYIPITNRPCFLWFFTAAAHWVRPLVTQKAFLSGCSSICRAAISQMLWQAMRSLWMGISNVP